jgi:hypothetical protein
MILARGAIEADLGLLCLGQPRLAGTKKKRRFV